MKSKLNQTVLNLSRSQFFRLVRRYSKAAGIPAHKRHPHVLKHSIAMQTIASAGIENVRQYLGHKSISSTGAYLKVSDGAQGLISLILGGEEGRWLELLNAKDERLRLDVQKYLTDRRDGKPAQGVFVGDTREGAPPLERGNLPSHFKAANAG